MFASMVKCRVHLNVRSRHNKHTHRFQDKSIDRTSVRVEFMPVQTVDPDQTTHSGEGVVDKCLPCKTFPSHISLKNSCVQIFVIVYGNESL